MQPMMLEASISAVRIGSCVFICTNSVPALPKRPAARTTLSLLLSFGVSLSMSIPRGYERAETRAVPAPPQWPMGWKGLLSEMDYKNPTKGALCQPSAP
ncbi:hypothetical protein D3C80_1639100 [compost metagenome]